MTTLPTATDSSRRLRHVALAIALLGTLTACGGGTDSPAADSGTAAVAEIVATGGDSAASVQAQPTFHMAPVVLDEPSALDADGQEASAQQAPLSVAVPASLSGLDTTRLTPQGLERARSRVQAAGAKPAASAQSTTVYTPAQIRAAYGLPALSGSAASLGAGQTIYIVDAYDHPNAFSDLNTFSTHFGLPTCTSVAIAANASLPLAAAPAASCAFSKVYATSAGKLTASAPAYNADWSSEIALDVEWAHATAPLARIVLIEAASASSSDLLGAIALANSMGSGVVSMSFGASEGNWTAGVDSVFTASGMSYLASTGDNGSQVNWPSVSANVLAVGGTTLTWSGSGTRSESAWSGTGGGLSAYTALPSYQSALSITGQGSSKKRGVADVSFNADPYSGQYVALTAPGGSTGWYAYGGTSISAPQWAGLLAVANAQRVAGGKAVLGAPHSALYTQIATSAANYAAAFADVKSGSDGTCAGCKAATGYDLPTGLGTPNATSLLSQLAGSAAAPVAPTVPGGSFTAKAGTAFSGSVGASGSGTLSYALSGAPSGLTISSAGVLSWAKPVKGSYSFSVKVTDPGGLSASASFTLSVTTPNLAPTISGVSVQSSASGLTLKVAASDPNGDTLSYKLAGAPSGMSISSAGVATWAKPVKGSYSFTVTVTDPGGLSAAATIKLTVS